MIYSNYLRHLEIETWIWFGLTMIAVILRYSSQYVHKGSIKSFMIDDWLMIPCLCAYIIVVVTLLKAAKYEGVFYNPVANPDFHRLGVTLVLCETASLTELWGVKACLLLLYRRITIHNWQKKLVRAVAAYCALGYVACILAFYVEFCHPFSQYFVGENTTNEQCITWLHYYITQWVFNVTSDLMILVIPLSLVWSSRLPLSNKISLCGIFGLGLFVVAAACGSKYYAVTNQIPPLNQWYIREGSVVIIVGNLVLCKPIFVKMAERAKSIGSAWTTLGRGSLSRSETSKPSVSHSSRSEGSVAKNGIPTMTEYDRSAYQV